MAAQADTIERPREHAQPELVVQFWPDRLAAEEPAHFSDQQLIQMFNRWETALATCEAFFTSSEQADIAYEEAQRLEVTLRKAHCRSKIGAAVKLLIYEHSSANGDCADDPKLLRRVICYLGGVV